MKADTRTGRASVKPNSSVGRRGFTLAEVMIALLVVAAAVITLVSTFTAGYLTTTRATYLEWATEAAHQRIEFYREQGFTLLPTFSGQSTTISMTPPTTLPTPSSGSVTFTKLDATLAPADPPAASDKRRKVDVTITWRDTKMGDRNVTLSAVICKE